MGLDRLSIWFNEHGMSLSPAAELHAQSTAQFLEYHAMNAPIVKPALLRTGLESLIARFPSNTILLSLYAANEARFSIDDRVRSVINQKVLNNGNDSNIHKWFFAIRYELAKSEIAGSTSHSIRALYKKAEEDIGANCPGLWKSHILFELRDFEKELARRPQMESGKDKRKRKEERLLEEGHRRVKETFLEGMMHLPWCKEYLMMPFMHLKKLFTEEELRKIYNVMVEKEMRIYVEV
jgi:hypothetical protein